MTYFLWVVLAIAGICTGLLVLGVLVAGVRRGHFRGVSLSEATKLEILMLPLGVVTIIVDAIALLALVVLVFVVR